MNPVANAATDQSHQSWTRPHTHGQQAWPWASHGRVQRAAPRINWRNALWTAIQEGAYSPGPLPSAVAALLAAAAPAHCLGRFTKSPSPPYPFTPLRAAHAAFARIPVPLFPAPFCSLQQRFLACLPAQVCELSRSPYGVCRVHWQAQKEKAEGEHPGVPGEEVLKMRA